MKVGVGENRKIRRSGKETARSTAVLPHAVTECCFFSPAGACGLYDGVKWTISRLGDTNGDPSGSVPKAVELNACLHTEC